MENNFVPVTNAGLESIEIMEINFICDLITLNESHISHGQSEIKVVKDRYIELSGTENPVSIQLFVQSYVEPIYRQNNKINTKGIAYK